MVDQRQEMVTPLAGTPGGDVGASYGRKASQVLKISSGTGFEILKHYGMVRRLGPRRGSRKAVGPLGVGRCCRRRRARRWWPVPGSRVVSAWVNGNRVVRSGLCEKKALAARARIGSAQRRLE